MLSEMYLFYHQNVDASLLCAISFPAFATHDQMLYSKTRSQVSPSLSKLWKRLRESFQIDPSKYRVTLIYKRVCSERLLVSCFISKFNTCIIQYITCMVVYYGMVLYASIAPTVLFMKYMEQRMGNGI